MHFMYTFSTFLYCTRSILCPSFTCHSTMLAIRRHRLQNKYICKTQTKRLYAALANNAAAVNISEGTECAEGAEKNIAEAIDNKETECIVNDQLWSVTKKSTLHRKKKTLSSRLKKMADRWIQIPHKIQYQRVDPPYHAEVPQLAHGLQRVLFNPGVHYFKDPRTKEYNFTPYLESVTQPDDFNYDAIAPYITSSKDTTLIDLAKTKAKRYVGSTSSVSSALAQLYFLMSNFKPVNTSCLSRIFTDQPTRFPKGIRTPYTFYLRWKDGAYAIDADKEFDNIETILSILGKSLEKVLTNEPAQYERYLKVNAANWKEEDRIQREAYAYGEMGKLLLRSQLDCVDERLPGKTFDLKTRAVLPIRMDSRNHFDYFGYKLKRSQGLFESFEREYYDMLRSAFLKYTFQVRMGHMDGILVAYHNTQTLFGFQYISKEEMDARLFGSTKFGDQVFRNSLYMFETILDKATQKYPERTLRISFNTRQNKSPDVPAHMYVYVEPVPREGECTKPAETVADTTNNLEEFFQTEESADEQDIKGLSPFDGLTAYQVNTSSMVNGAIMKGPLILNNYRRYNWSLRMKIQEILQDDPEEKRKRFVALRRTQYRLNEPSRKNPFTKHLKALIERNTKHDRF